MTDALHSTESKWHIKGTFYASCSFCPGLPYMLMYIVNTYIDREGSGDRVR